MALKKYRHTVEVNLNDQQHQHVERLAGMAGVPKSRVLRQLVQDSVDRSNGVYDPLPSAEVLALAFAHVTNEED